MYIEVVRVGGVAGMTRRAHIDTESLDDETSVREWHALAEAARPMLVSPDTDESSDRPPARARDGFEWTVSVDDTTCRFGDSAITGALRTLAQRTLREGRAR